MTALTLHVWGDDAQVVAVTASKEYAAHASVAGAVIRIQQDTGTPA